MNNRSQITLLLAIAFLVMPLVAMAQEYVPKRVVWRSKPGSSTGLYTTHNYFVSHGVSLNASALYYFGDVDNEGVAFSGGFNKENLSYGGGLQFAYNLPAGNHCNIRFGLMGGMLRGNNKVKLDNLDLPRDDYRKFQSFFIQPAVGVQYYPFSQAGFYIYGGLAATFSIITNFEFWYYQQHVRQPEPLTGKTYGLLPMVQLAIGYSWRLSNSWTMSAELMVQEGLIDTQYMNLDAFPLDPSQNSKGVALGNSFGKWTDRYGKEHIHWNDGWFQLGITVSYHWRNCEHCRVLNSYQNIRMKRR
jgi:hypothetical protein